ncbi:DNA-directed DNA polymerase alpha subunit pol12 [Coniosporium apollinis]|uniref:DNA polymerase alpha subunit B n=2 Tax=Coniosporium TaxID=2810619 RepID=A0ABQ9NUB0_9PEZI|nr:DNA-directed DNA polymerase alpha subunit pol12 [Coniosporium apollinis]
MAENMEKLNELFAAPSSELRPEVLGELQSILRLYSISPQDLFYKWESYSLKMGAEDTKLDLKTARNFKRDIQDILERESRGKAHARGQEKRGVGATPRAAGSSDVFGMLDNLIPNTPASRAVNGSAAKRKSTFETPLAKASRKDIRSSPGGHQTPDAAKAADAAPVTSFADRANAGQTIETLNAHIDLPSPVFNAPTEPRIKFKANTELTKFAYKTSAMKLSEASEILDDRIDEFLSLVQLHHQLEDTAFGNPAAQSTSEIIAVGRIASDTAEGRLNAASLVLETSRRTGAGLRVPLKVEQLSSYEFFPGKIVALRGSNANGDYFTVSEELAIPLLPPAASFPAELDAHNARLASTSASADDEAAASTPPRPLTVLIASGPYTPATTLDFSAFTALLETAATTKPDVLILYGPFLDAEHPSLINGALDLPASFSVQPDQATLTDVFRYHISLPLTHLLASSPSTNVILIPSVRDAVARHAAFPQNMLDRKELGLPKGVRCVTNPVTMSFNEAVWGFSGLDVLDMVRREEVVGGAAKGENLFVRAVRGVVGQRSFCPVFPPTAREALPGLEGVDGKEEGKEGEEGEDGEGKWLPMGAMLDTSYLRLAEWLNVRPDVLVLPSVLTPFAKVVESMLTINPGTLSKKRGPGTYARVTVLPAAVSDEEREKGEVLGHRMFERCRVDIVRI